MNRLHYSFGIQTNMLALTNYRTTLLFPANWQVPAPSSITWQTDDSFTSDFAPVA